MGKELPLYSEVLSWIDLQGEVIALSECDGMDISGADIAIFIKPTLPD